MAARIVLLGWAGEAAEVNSTEAGALIASGMARVSLTKWAGELSDATVLVFRPEYLHAHGGEADEKTHRAAYERALLLIGGRPRQFRVKLAEVSL